MYADLWTSFDCSIVTALETLWDGHQDQPSSCPSPQLRLFEPQDGEERGGRREEGKAQTTDSRLPCSLPPPPSSLLSSEAAAEAALDGLSFSEDAVQPLAQAEAVAAGNLSLAGFWTRYGVAWRQTRISLGKVSRATVSKDRQAIRRWREWDEADTRMPAGWPTGMPWRGMPLRKLSSAWLERGLGELVQRLAKKTVETTWTHLRSVLSHAVKLGIIPSVPKVERLQQTLLRVSDAEDADVAAFSDAELGAVYRCFTGRPQEWRLKAALALCVNAGPRSESDLFSLRFSDIKDTPQGPELVFRAKKTGKRHRIALAPCVAAHVEKLRRDQAFLIPDGDAKLFTPLNVRPWNGKKRLSAVRNTELRRAIEAAGLDASLYAKPWQSVRKSCTTRFNAHAGDVGSLITHGPSGDTAGRYYDQIVRRIRDAVKTIAWPAEFSF